MLYMLYDGDNQPNQWLAMQSLVHSSWQTQHQFRPQPGLVQTMCIQPPSLSVGVRHPGQGLEMTLMVRLLGSTVFHLARTGLSGPPLSWPVWGGGEERQGPR